MLFRSRKSTKGGAPFAHVHLNGRLPCTGGVLMPQGGLRTSSSKTATTPKSNSTFLGFRTSSSTGKKNSMKEKVRGKNQSMHPHSTNHSKTKFSSRFGHDSSSDDGEGRDMFRDFESRFSSDSEDGEYPAEIDVKTKREREEQVERLVGIIARQKGVSLIGSSGTGVQGLNSRSDVTSGAECGGGGEAGEIGEAREKTVARKEQSSRDCKNDNLQKNSENYHRRPLISGEEAEEEPGDEEEQEGEDQEEEIVTRSGTIGGERDKLRRTRWTQGIFGAGKKSDVSPSTGVRAKTKENEKTKGKGLMLSKSSPVDDTQIIPDLAQSGTGRGAKKEHSLSKLDEKEVHVAGGRFKRIFGGSKDK